MHSHTWNNPMFRLIMSVHLHVLRAVSLVICLAAPLSAAVKLEAKDEEIIVLIDDAEFTTFHFAKSLPKPYFWPVRAPSGVIMTRPNIPGQKEHPHHRGIWVTVDEVNELKHWRETNRVECQSADITISTGDHAELIVVNHWLDAKSPPQPVLKETTTVRIFSNRLMVFDIELKPLIPTVTFGDTKEGFLAFRFDDPLKGDRTGKIRNADGLEGEAGCWGKPSAWIDYVGHFENDQVGVALFDHPQNFRPSRYHVRNYGLYTISPFGEGAYQNALEKAAPVTLTPTDKPLQLRYGMFIHSGSLASGDVKATYETYLKLK
jgi:Methane oxygenase PmoA